MVKHLPVVMLLPLVSGPAQDEFTPLDIICLGEMKEARAAFKLAHAELLSLKADPGLKSGNEKLAGNLPLTPHEIIAPLALGEKQQEVNNILTRYGELKATFRKQRAAAIKPQVPVKTIRKA